MRLNLRTSLIGVVLIGGWMGLIRGYEGWRRGGEAAEYRRIADAMRDDGLRKEILAHADRIERRRLEISGGWGPATILYVWAVALIAARIHERRNPSLAPRPASWFTVWVETCVAAAATMVVTALACMMFTTSGSTARALAKVAMIALLSVLIVAFLVGPILLRGRRAATLAVVVFGLVPTFYLAMFCAAALGEGF